jgi:hypothetical protein
MKKRYTRRQIREAIAYWSKVLEDMDEPCLKDDEITYTEFEKGILSYSASEKYGGIIYGREDEGYQKDSAWCGTIKFKLSECGFDDLVWCYERPYSYPPYGSAHHDDWEPIVCDVDLEDALDIYGRIIEEVMKQPGAKFDQLLATVRNVIKEVKRKYSAEGYRVSRSWEEYHRRGGGSDHIWD